MQNNSSETLLRGIFLYLLLNVKYLVFSVTLGNYYIVKYTWNLLDAEVLLSLKVVKVEKSREVRETFIDIQQCHGRVLSVVKGGSIYPRLDHMVELFVFVAFLGLMEKVFYSEAAEVHISKLKCFVWEL